jgi:elongation factor Tu
MAKDKFERKKPHVNVGTIGHVDHGKTTLTASITHVQSLKGLAAAISYDQVAKASESQGRRDPTKILTIAISHVEYESNESPLRARRLPRPCRLRQEHDHRRGPDGRRDPGGQRGGRSDAPDQGAHPAGPPGRCARDRGVPEQGRPVDDPELLDLVELEIRELLNKYEFPGDTAAIRGSAWAR